VPFVLIRAIRVLLFLCFAVTDNFFFVFYAFFRGKFSFSFAVTDYCSP